MNNPQALIQLAIDNLSTYSDWSRKAAMKAHMCGLQGEKRRLRYLYRKANMVVDTLQHSMYDLFSVELYPRVGSANVVDMMCPKTTMAGMIKTMWTMYEQLHKVANDLIGANMRSLASPIYGYCGCLLDILSELQRTQKEYEWANWEYHHISRHQVSHSNVHDKYEDKEESQGYSDHEEA